MKQTLHHNPHPVAFQPGGTACLEKHTLVWILSLGLLAAGCRCGDDEILATAEEVTAPAERDFAASQNRWQKASDGAEFRVGDGIQSKSGGGAVLALGDGSYAKLAENSRIRFFALEKSAHKNGRKIEVETGELEIEVGSDDLTLVTEMGSAEIKSGSRVRIRRDGDRADFAVNIGEAVFFDKKQQRIEATAGDVIDLEIGVAVIRKPNRDTETDPAEDTESPTLASADSPDLDTSDTESPEPELSKDPTGPRTGSRREEAPPSIPSAPGTPDFFAPAGESFTVHAAGPPVIAAIGTRNKCPKEAAMRIGRKWVGKGTESVPVSLSAGRHRYRIHCLDDRGFPKEKAVASAHIFVKRDAGKKRLPKVAPSSFVETDGRRYNILYQSILPTITVQWPEAPAGQKYVLHVTSDGKTRNLPQPKPEARLKSGFLGEGVHRLKFEAKGTLSRTSRTTEVRIGYDSAAPSAGIFSPAEGEFSHGQTVTVSGEAAPGWKVSVAGRETATDHRRRFSRQTVFQGPYRAIAVRLSQARRGIHYYLRRGNTP